MMKDLSELEPLRLVEEGRARVYVPRLEAYKDSYGHMDPARAPVFYNPRMISNRDLAVCGAETYAKLYKRRDMRLAEPFCSTGVRGIRYALEVSQVEHVLMGDISEKAVKLANINVLLNRVQEKVKVIRSEAKRLLISHIEIEGRFDLIDVDPFGSPASFILNAIEALREGGLLAVTATDLPPLFGVHPPACRRKYSSVPLRVSYSPEIGTRILIGYIAREAAKMEKGIEVLLAYHMDHYIRAYVIVERGARKADQALGNIGYVLHCQKCGWRDMVKGFLPRVRTSYCPLCHGELMLAGPLWIGSLARDDFSKEVLHELREREYLLERRRLIRMMEKIRAEMRIGKPFYYTTSEVARLVRRNEVKVVKLIEVLKDNGYEATVTHFDPKGVKTNADLKAVMRAYIELTA